MKFTLLGWPEDAPTLRLDFRAFSYAGKFVMSNTGKAVLRREGDGEGEAAPSRPDADLPPTVDPDVFDDGVLAAIAFNEDRVDPGVLWFRYVTVHADRRGEGLGAELAAAVVERAEERGYRRFRIAVNNPFAYEAMYKAGFVYTGRRTGLAELVLERPGHRDAATYQCGLDEFRAREKLSDVERSYLDGKEGAEAPPLLEPAFGRGGDFEGS